MFDRMGFWSNGRLVWFDREDFWSNGRLVERALSQMDIHSMNLPFDKTSPLPALFTGLTLGHIKLDPTLDAGVVQDTKNFCQNFFLSFLLSFFVIQFLLHMNTAAASSTTPTSSIGGIRPRVTLNSTMNGQRQWQQPAKLGRIMWCCVTLHKVKDERGFTASGKWR